MARVAHRPPYRRLAGRQGVLPRPLSGRVRWRADRQPRSAHPAGHRRLHDGHGAGDQHPDRGDVADAVVRDGELHGVGGGVRPDPVESGWAADVLRCHRAQGAVLDGAALCGRDDRRGVLDRQADHPADLPQRSDQRGLPLRVGAHPRRRRGGGLLPWRAHRTRCVVDALRTGHRELSQAGTPRRGVHRLEPDHEPARLPASVDHPGAANVLRRVDVRRRHAVGGRVRQRAVLTELLPLRVRRVRGLPSRDHPLGRAGHGERTGKGATAIGGRGHRRRRRRAGRRGRQLARPATR